MSTSQLTDATHQMLDISTSHIPKHTANALGDEGNFVSCDLYKRVVYTPWSGYGWIFWAGQELPEIENTHPELLAVLEYAQANGYDYLKLDCDAEKINDLPTFEW